MLKLSIFFIAILFTFSQQSIAEFSYDVSGFGTLGISVGDNVEDTQIESFGYDESLEVDNDTRLGLQSSIYYQDSLSLTVQGVYRAADDDRVNLDWFYLGYRPVDSTTIRIGRMQRPVYFHSDHVEVAYIYPWVRAPMDIYSSYIKSLSKVEGISLLYEIPVNNWDIGFETYYGSAEDQLNWNEGEELVDYEVENSYGIVLFAATDTVEVKLNYHAISDGRFEVPERFDPVVEALELGGYTDAAEALNGEDYRGEYYNASINYDRNSWLMATEYTHVPDPDDIVTGENSWYVMGGKRWQNYTFHITYAERDRKNKGSFTTSIREDIATLSALPSNPFTDAQIAALTELADGVDAAAAAAESEQESITLGVRYDFNKPISLKFNAMRLYDQLQDEEADLFTFSVDFIF